MEKDLALLYSDFSKLESYISQHIDEKAPGSALRDARSKLRQAMRHLLDHLGTIRAESAE